jgi:hypothetical protein
MSSAAITRAPAVRSTVAALAGGPSRLSFTPEEDRALMNRMTDETAERMAKNEAHFRRINESVKDGLLHAPGGLAERDDLVGFVCECSNLECSHLVYAPASVYRRVRDSDRRFLVCSGHDERGIEDVVESAANYSIVEKRGRAGHVAAAAG